ncbi:hypothetical protein ACGFZP_37595 [Kitasatospora sp. NPDC048239]|uniref:hypothetical protein n=1 Tax=Kitasatospora sp. NPDC048239 TaxID=3364046 RepID=UPI003717785C
MNNLASTMALIVADPLASCRFFTTHLGYREALTVEEFAGLTREVPPHCEPRGVQRLELTDPNGVVIQLAEWAPPAGA